MLTRRAILAGAALGLPGGVTRWPGSARAAVSLTYDDGLDSQLDTVALALERRGLRGTFFLTVENMAARVEDWRQLADRGHEIGNHTASHPCELRSAALEPFRSREIVSSQSFLDTHFGSNPERLFAYPCGVIDLGPGSQQVAEQRYISTLRGRFLGARAADGDPNDPRQVSRNRYQLQAVAPTYDADDPALAADYVRRAERMGFWAVLIFHDVLPRRLGDGDTSVASHDAFLDWLGRRRVWTAPMGEVLQHIGVRA